MSDSKCTLDMVVDAAVAEFKQALMWILTNQGFGEITTKCERNGKKQSVIVERSSSRLISTDLV